jgi:predicted ribosome quality control (RQC) complex YloA/Tae2 family protein
MIPAISNTQYPVNQLLRQQTERQAQQAELQAQMLEQQAAAKRREARQAQQTARDLDAAASESANRAKVLQQNQQQLSERLNATRQPEQPPSSTTDGSNSPTITNRSAAISTDSSRAQNLNASAVFNSIAKPPGPSTGLAINLQI